MKTKIISLLFVALTLTLAAFLVHFPKPAHADEIPEKYRGTVQRGLEYLVKHQFEDGHWEGDDGQHPVAMTGLVGIALLMERNIPKYDGFNTSFTGKTAIADSKYSANIRKAADWLMGKSQAARDGLIFSDHPSETTRYMQGHGLATLFLAGALNYEGDNTRRKKLTEVITRAVKYIIKAQSGQGGWYHTSKVEGHDFQTILETVIQFQALEAAEIAGISVPGEVTGDAQRYLKMALGEIEGGSPTVKNRRSTAETAAALSCLVGPDLGPGKQDEWNKKWFKYCQTEIPVGPDLEFGRDELIHYYYAQAAFKSTSETWGDYSKAILEPVQNSQNKDGSWPAGDGIGVGPVYSTAVWSAILQLENRSHPSRWPLPIATN